MYDENTINFLQKQFERAWANAPANGFDLIGKCHDCKENVTVKVDVDNDTGKFVVSGGGVRYMPTIENPLFKCDKCLAISNVFTEYQPCEIFTRVCGYLRPTQSFNPGKKAEFRDRVNYLMDENEKVI